MIDSVGAPSGRTSWVIVWMGMALLLPAPAAAQSGVDRGVADAARITPATTAGARARHDPAPAESRMEPAGSPRAGRSIDLAPTAATWPASVGAGRSPWRSPAAHGRLGPHDVDRFGRLAWAPLAVIDRRSSQGDDPHPLRGGLATFGGMLAGFGVGLAVDEPAAGLLVGTGVGLVTTAVLRTFGDR